VGLTGLLSGIVALLRMAESDCQESWLSLSLALVLRNWTKMKESRDHSAVPSEPFIECQLSIFQSTEQVEIHVPWDPHPSPKQPQCANLSNLTAPHSQ